MKYLPGLLVSAFLYWHTSIYTLHFYKAGGGDQSFSAYQGRKILLVNIATGSDKVNQLAGLKQLQAMFSDSLVVIAFPSNSFGAEPRTSSEIKAFCDSLYQPNFIIADKAPVAGTDAQSTFRWLASEAENGAGDIRILGDYQKYVLNEQGEVIGVFAGSVPPLDPKLKTLIQQ